MNGLHYKEDVFRAIKGSTQDSPMKLKNIIAFVDGRQRLVLYYEEMLAILTDLFKDNVIAEAEH